MINILKQGSSLLITSDNNQFPWKDGKMSVPLNSIAYIIDESDYVTFRSVANNDILFTSLIGELKINNESVSKGNLITMFDSVANSSGGGTASAGVNSINGFQGDINIKTVNGTSLIGSGDISVEADLSNYYTKEESDDHYDNDKRYWNDFQYTTDNYNWIHLRNGKSLRGNPIYFKTINGEKTVGMGDIPFKTINGESLIGSGDITVEGGSDIEEYVKKIIVNLDNSQIIYYYKNTDGDSSTPIMFKTVNGESLLGMGDITIEGGSVEETDPIFTEWKNDSSIVCGNGAVNGINNFGTLLKRSNAVAIGNGASIQTDNSIAIGNNAKIFASTASSSKGLVAIGNEVSVSAIANDSTINKYVKTNINNQLKFATDDTMFIKGMSTNGTSNDWFIVNGEWTGTQSQYDALGTYYSNVTYNIIEG